MKYKNFKEFFWKSAIFRIGLPWGFLTGFIFVIIQEKEILRYFLSIEALMQILIFTILGGLLMAFGAGKHLWKISKRSESKEELEKENI